MRTAPELPQAPQDTRDPAAFALLIRAHARLLRLAERLLGERTAAEDALQDAVLSAWRGYDHFRGDSQPATWLHAIVVRSCITHHRRSGPTEPLDAIEESSRLWADAAYTVDPADAAIRASEVDTLNAAIAVLPVVYRGALLLHDMEGYTAAEIADMTDVPLATAKARIRRARMTIVTALGASTFPLAEEATPC